jgi:hypothetical protein
MTIGYGHFDYNIVVVAVADNDDTWFCFELFLFCHFDYDI